MICRACRATAVLGTSRCWDHLGTSGPHSAGSAIASQISANEPVTIAGAELDASQFKELAQLVGNATAVTPPDLDAHGTTLTGEIDIPRLKLRRLDLSDALVEGSLTIDGTSAEVIDLQDATVSRRLRLDGPRGRILLTRTKVAGQLMVEMTSGASLLADDIEVAGSADFNWIDSPLVRLENGTFHGPLLVRATGNLDLTSVTAAKPARIEWVAGDRGDLPDAPLLELTDGRFGGGLVVGWGAGTLVVHRARLGGPSVFDKAPESATAPKLSSALNLDAADVALRDVNLETTLFGGAQNLGKLSEFDPARLPALQRNPLMVPRPVLYDELVFRGLAWDKRVTDPAETLPATPGRLEHSYRSLRKALEDGGDVPAANELYFAERYWRRRRLGWPAKLPLVLYEAVSGYGVRPLRSLLALVIVLVAAAFAFDQNDTLTQRVTVAPKTRAVTELCADRPPVLSADQQVTVTCPTDLAASFEYSARSATSLLRSQAPYEVRGTAVWIDVTLRIAAPGLFALFILALRSRVHR